MAKNPNLLPLLDTFLAREQEESSISIDATNSMVVNILAVSLVASSHGYEVVLLYRHVCGNHPLEKQLMVQRRMKEALVKTSTFYGLPKALQALFPLFKSLDEEKGEVDDWGARWDRISHSFTTTTTTTPLAPTDLLTKGEIFFTNLWGPTAAAENSAFNLKHCPDLHFVVTLVLIWIIADDSLYAPHETCMLNAAAMICSMNGAQSMWHTRVVVRQGGTMAQARLARDLGVAVKELYRDVEVPGDRVADFEKIDFEDLVSHA
ncbi:uncharacterized protein LTR77_000431 [Saxophila tyrrhenica]|uniref:Uncharacterized protein n=1 Tax=Saxophila tyrrhenica TaxID=1690608 RepID=A0AAV9PPU2_9PEZI|nr:hypothetical protein LTR77_000431 [Saxophila tyrrhenica]